MLGLFIARYGLRTGVRASKEGPRARNCAPGLASLHRSDNRVRVRGLQGREGLRTDFFCLLRTEPLMGYKGEEGPGEGPEPRRGACAWPAERLRRPRARGGMPRPWTKTSAAQRGAG